MEGKRRGLNKDASKVSLLKYRILGKTKRFLTGSDERIGKELSLTFIYSMLQTVLVTHITSFAFCETVIR